MELLERQKAVADAILLERAAGVLERRSMGGRTTYTVETFLTEQAVALRQEAESGG